MATSVIKWNEGEGNIVATYTGSGNAPISIVTDVPNEGIDREQVITVKTLGNIPIECEVLVKQTGLREVLADADGELLLSNEGETLNALKEWVTI